MLLHDVASHGKQVGFRVPDGVLPLDPQKPQEDLLSDIRHIVNIAQADRQKPTQPPPITGGDLGDEMLSTNGPQSCALTRESQDIRALSIEKWV